MNKAFYTCKKCDFEWHSEDGMTCPICRKKTNYETLPSFAKGGMFGTGGNPKRLKQYYKAIGLIALVYLIYYLLGG